MNSTVQVPIEKGLADGQWHERSLCIDERHVSVMLRFCQGQWQGFLNACPHQGRRMDYAPDQFLLSPQGTLVCPAHGAEFRAEDGFCVNGPCRGASLKPITISENETGDRLFLSADWLTAG